MQVIILTQQELGQPSRLLSPQSLFFGVPDDGS